MTAIQGPFIPEFYNGREVLVTGATGFMGKVLVEKLLRSCSGLERIYVLLRGKHGVESRKRLEELLSTEIFDSLRQSSPNVFSKVFPIQGDLTLPGLGLGSSEQSLLLESVSVVFHSAATVKFDEPLRRSVEMNVVGTRRLVELCHKMKRLEALIHVSTAYCNCNKEEVHEVIYEPPVAPQNVIDALGWMDEDVLTAITPQLLGDRPNTYTFTKALAESLIAQDRGSLPVAIVRPSIVTAAWKEPIPGWIDNINGPTGLIVASGKGLLRSMLADKDKAADFVPVDVVINLMITVAWYTATKRPQDIMVFNCASGLLNRLTWGDIATIAYPFLLSHPMPNAMRYPGGSFKSSRILNALSMAFEHRVPAEIYDAYLLITGKKPRMVRLFTKLYKVMVSLQYFTTHEWKFHCPNVGALLDQLSTADRQLYCIDLRQLDWSDYFKDYVIGTRTYLLKEAQSTIPEGRKALKRLYFYQQILNFFLVIFFWRVLLARSKTVQSLWYTIMETVVRLHGLFLSVSMA